MASRRHDHADDGLPTTAGPDHDAPDTVSGQVVLDVGRSDRSLLDSLEPRPAVRQAAEWGALMDGRLEVRAGALTWVPGEYARRFGFIAFTVPAEEIVSIRVASQPSLRGSVTIDLTHDRTVAVRVPDPDRWRTALGRAAGF